LTNLNKKLIWTLLLGVATVIVITFLADFRATAEALGRFKIVYLPLIIGLTFVNYLLRFIKWQFFLKQIDIVVPLKDSFVIFLGGLAMSVTPGKVGELLKSLLLKELKGIAVSRTAPVILAERLSDGFGLIVLALSGATIFRYGKGVLLVTALLMTAMVVIIGTPGLSRIFVDLCSRIPAANRFAGILEKLMQSAGQLLKPGALLFTALISVVSWSFECVAFYFVFAGLGYQVSVLAATFTLTFSSVVGAVSMLPGGLGAVEGSIMGLLVKVVGVPGSIAAAATILIRFCTLWFAVALGFIALAANRRLIGFVNNMGAAGEGKGAAE